ncbi:hypothetical protein [Sphingomonas limnosediminicola]
MKSIAYGCGDVVVVGAVRNVEGVWEHVEIEGDFLGHGWATAYVRIKHVLRGNGARASVYARYSDHTYRAFARGQQYLLVLQPRNDRTYTIRSIQRWSSETRSKLARTCT